MDTDKNINAFVGYVLSQNKYVVANVSKNKSFYLIYEKIKEHHCHIEFYVIKRLAIDWLRAKGHRHIPNEIVNKFATALKSSFPVVLSNEIKLLSPTTISFIKNRYKPSKTPNSHCTKSEYIALYKKLCFKYNLKPTSDDKYWERFISYFNFNYTTLKAIKYADMDTPIIPID